MKIRKKATVLAVLSMLVVSLIVAVLPVLACTAGCTPGFWKRPQHFGYWTAPYVPDGDTPTKVGDVFDADVFPDLADDTLLEALNYGGGPGAEGAAKILLRAAVATLLNAAYDETQGFAWGWDWWYDNLADQVHDKLTSGNRGRMIRMAEDIDGWNNQGCQLEGQLWE